MKKIRHGKMYDYKKAIKIMKKNGAEKAKLGMLEDWRWTADEVTIPELEKMKNGVSKIMGIEGSCWATPVLEIDNDGKVKSFDCYYEDNKYA